MDCKECRERLHPENPGVGYSFKGRYYPPLCQGCPNEGELKINKLEDRLEALEAISAQKGGIPHQYYDQLQQLRGEIAYLRGKIIEKPPIKAPAKKSAYQGLSVER